jgi:hypothetical protein
MGVDLGPSIGQRMHYGAGALGDLEMGIVVSSDVDDRWVARGVESELQ